VGEEADAHPGAHQRHHTGERRSLSCQLGSYA
jgi:hypothetical protein